MRDLSAEEWSVVKRAYLACAGADVDSRERVLRAECGEHEALCAAVREMLATEGLSAVTDAQPHLAIGVPGSLADTDDEPLPIMIGPYRVRSLLGEGTFGIVYLCEDRSPSRLVAVKVLRPGLASRSSIRRFRQEPELLARLDHPSIVRVLAAGMTSEHPARPYFAMEYVEGVPITRHLADRVVAREDALRLFLAVLDGVQRAHDHGVLHRDLKPGNILVTRDGQARILDFGLARVIERGEAPTSPATTAAHVLGTVLYASPEQLQGGLETADITADVYSLGIVLYEVLARRAAFDGAGRLPHECIRMVCEREPLRLGDIDRSLRGDLELIVQTAIAKDRTKRYPTVSEFAADIRRYLAKQPIAARPPTLAYQLRTLSKRHRSAFALAGVSLFVILTLVAWLAVTRQQARRDYVVARNTAGTLLHQVTTRLGVLSGTGEERRRIIAELAPAVERFAARTPDDRAAQLALARLRLARADLAHESGDKAAAESLRRGAIDVLEPIWSRSNGDAVVRQEWAYAAIKLGDALKERGDLDAAERWYLRASDAEQLGLLRSPDDLQLRSDQLWSMLRLGNMAYLAGRHADAELLLREQIVSASWLLGKHPDVASLWYARMCGEMELAACLRGRGEEADYLAHLLRAVETGERLLTLEPHNRGYAIQHCINALSAVQLLALGGRTTEARTMLDGIEPVCRRLVALDGGEPVSLTASLLHTRARVLEAEGRAQEALAAWIEAASLLKARWERAPMDQLLAREFAGAAAYAADALGARGAHAEADFHAESGVLALRTAIRDAAVRPDVALQLGGLLLRSVPGTNAHARLMEALAVTDDALSDFPLDIDLLQMKARLHEALGERSHAAAVYAELLSRRDLAEHSKRSVWKQLHSVVQRASNLADEGSP